MIEGNATALQRQSLDVSALPISSTLMLVRITTTATTGRTTVSTVRTPKRVTCSGSTSVPGRYSTSADRSSSSSPECARISSRVR